MILTKEKIDSSEFVWKALADPTRRRLMDLVRESPKTTGGLVEEFKDIGRCAVMKHLGILEEAGLITARKQGKFRWNYINAIPLQEIYERWVKKYEAQWATGLLQLKEVAEFKSNINQITEEVTMDTQQLQIDINLEIPINAPQQKVWDCLLNDINLWWRKDFYTSPNTKEFIIEPKIGGKMYEDYGNGNGLLWAEIIILDAPRVVEFKGRLTPQFGGPAMSFIRIALEEKDGTTVLLLTDTVFGNVSEESKEQLTAGWKLLYEETFKSYVESK